MKIKSDVCAYVKVTPYTCDFTFRNQSKPFPGQLAALGGWKRFLNRKVALKKFDCETGEIYQTAENRFRALRRARKAVVDYALCNDFEYFGTITIDPAKHDVTRPDLVKEALCAKFHSYQVMHPDLKYIFVPEYGENTNRLHFHFLASGLETFVNEHGYTDCHLFRDNFGFCNMQKIGSDDADKLQVSLYCSKYITKQNVRIAHRYFFNSKGLKKPDKLFLSGQVALAAYDELRKLNAREFADLKYCKCFGCSAAQWGTIWEKVSVWQEIQAAHRLHWSKFKRHVWLKGPYKMSVSELSIFDSVNVQLSLC